MDAPRVNAVATILTGFSLACLAIAGPAQAQANSDLMGRWATEGFDSIVELTPCPGDADAICGRVLWLWDEADASGQPRKDIRNPDKSLRARPIVGIEIVHGLKRSASGTSFSGLLYDPDDGRTYTGVLQQRGRTLELKGCALTLFCDTQIWRRAADVVAAAGPAATGR